MGVGWISVLQSSNSWVGIWRDPPAQIVSMDDYHKAQDALTLPNDATALNELIAERTADKETEVKHLLGKLMLANNAIAELTAEVERLKVAAEFDETIERLREQSVDELTAQRDEAMKLLAEARRTFEMWKDVAPAVSLCADIDAAIAKSKEGK